MLGVCNGFQILTEAGLLPGALTRNAHQRFECGDWFVKVTAEGPFTAGSGEVWRLPDRPRRGALPGRRRDAAPARGRGAHRPALLHARRARSTSARTRTAASTRIAGIYGGPRKNVFGLMPHPERMSEALLGGADGRKLFERVLSQA